MKTFHEIQEEAERRMYTAVRHSDPDLYEQIVAFASIFGITGEVINIRTRHQVERFCMGLVWKK